MGQMKSSIILDLTGNLERQADRFSGSLGRLSASGSRHMGMLSRSMSAVGSGLDRLGNRYMALATGAAGLGTLRMVADLSARMTQLGVDAGISEKEVDALRQKIFDISRAPDIRVDASETATALEEIVKAVGDLPFAEKNLRNLGLVMRATAGTGKDVGLMAAELQKLDKAASPENILKAFDIFNEQGKAGAVALRDLSEVGPRTFSAYASMRKGVDPATFVRELGAALQTIKGGAGDVRNAATSFEALMRVFADKKNLSRFKAAGIQIFDLKALKAGREELRPINELMAEIVEKTKGRVTLLDSLIPDAEAKRALTVSNLTENLRRYYAVEADGSATTKDAARNARELNAVLISISASWKDISSRNLTGPLRWVADGLGGLKPETVDLLFKAGVALTGIVGALIIGRKIYESGSWLTSLFRKSPVGDAAGGLGGGRFGEPIPVYVVNGPNWRGRGSAGVPTGAAAGAASRAGTTAAAASPVLAMAAPLIPAAGTAVAFTLSEAIGKTLAEWEVKNRSTEKLTELLRRHEVMGGGGDTFQARLIREELNRRPFATEHNLPPAEPVNGLLKIEIDSPFQTRVRQLSARGIDLDVDCGRMFMASH